VNIKRPLFWHQGLFLQPQHFQYADAHHEWAATALDRAIHPNHWGVVELGLNEERLNSGVIEIERGTFLLRDGTHVSIPDNAVVATRDFRADWEADQNAFAVYLGIRRLSDAETNVTVVPDREAATGVQTRFASLADADPMPDVHQGREEAVQVKTMFYVMRLFWERELDDAEDYDTLPLLRLVRDGDAIQLDPTAPGSRDNSNAALLAGLAAGAVSASGQPPASAYADLVAANGVRTQQASASRDAFERLQQQDLAAREAVSGVNLDEEAANLLRLQQSFQAAAQVISTADTLFQTLLGAVRR